jgi:hypothetical protein
MNSPFLVCSTKSLTFTIRYDLPFFLQPGCKMLYKDTTLTPAPAKDSSRSKPIDRWVLIERNGIKPTFDQTIDARG